MIRTLARHVLFLLRPLGRRVSPRVLWFGLWPLAGVASALELARQSARVARFARLPRTLRPAGWGLAALWVQRTRENLSSVLSLWTDAFALPRWRGVFRFAGDARSCEAVESGTRPVILFTLHFGSGDIVQHWMRSRGIAACLVTSFPDRQNPPHRLHLNRLADEEFGFADLPRRLLHDQHWRIVRHLRRNGVLGVPASAAVPGRIAVRHGDVTLPLAPGALRLGALTGARLIPAIFIVHGGADLALHLAPEVTAEDLADPARHPAALESILGFFVDVMRIAPGQMHPHLLRQLTSPQAGSTLDQSPSL